MDLAILNPATAITYADIPTEQLEVLEDAILARREDACERLVEDPPLAPPVSEGEAGAQLSSGARLSPLRGSGERIFSALSTICLHIPFTQPTVGITQMSLRIPTWPSGRG